MNVLENMYKNEPHPSNSTHTQQWLARTHCISCKSSIFHKPVVNYDGCTSRASIIYKFLLFKRVSLFMKRQAEAQPAAPFSRPLFLSHILTNDFCHMQAIMFLLARPRNDIEKGKCINHGRPAGGNTCAKILLPRRLAYFVTTPHARTHWQARDWLFRLFSYTRRCRIWLGADWRALAYYVKSPSAFSERVAHILTSHLPRWRGGKLTISLLINLQFAAWGVCHSYQSK